MIALAIGVLCSLIYARMVDARKQRDAARDALIRMVEACPHPELRLALANLRSDPVVEQGEDQITIGKWHVQLRDRTFVVTIVAGPIFAEYSGVFTPMESGAWQAAITSEKHN